MRRVIIYILVSIICGACSQTAEEIDTTAQKIVFGVEVSAPEARTALVNENGKYKAIWKAGDTFSVVQIADSDSALYSGTVAEDAASIVVNAEFEQSAATKFAYIFASPAATVSADCSYLEMSLPEEQSPAAMNTFDSTSDLILSNAVERESQPNGENVPFIAERISAVGKMTVKNLPLAEGEQVTSVTFTTTQPLAGSISNIKVSDIVAGNDALLNATYLNPKGTITINLPEPQSGEFTLYFSCLPATLPAGSEYSVTVTSTNSTYTKQAQIPSNLSFTAGRMTSFTVNMTDNSQDIASNNKILYTSSDGKIVTPYATDVFGATIVSNTYENGQGVIVFDGEVTSIGNYAFYYCSSLTSVTIPDSVTEIGTAAFAYCSSLTSVTIPDSVTTLGNNSFGGCSKLTEFNGKFASADKRCLIVDGVLNSFAPAGLTEYTIPDSVTKIGSDAFRDCSSLTSVTIPDSVTKIGSYAFYSCSSLTSVTIPDSVTTIGSGAFNRCSSLTSVTIPDSVTTLGTNPFYGCSKLTEFNGKFASADKRCLIVDGVLNSFAIGCGLTEYAIPNSVTEIGKYAFFGCSSLTTVTIPDSVTEIGSNAFQWCSSLTSVTIPDSVTKIGSYAFESCSSLKSVYCKPITPPTADKGDYSSWYAFNNNATDRKIYVPAASVEAYKTAAGWSNYADAIVAEGATSGVVDLSVAGTANCYLVNGAGNYKFKAVKGNSLENFSNGYSADVLWESFGTSTTPNVGDLITNVAYKDGYISFSTPATFKSGNASVALRDSSGKILWSWHIWCSAEGWSDQVYPNNAGTMMDRNLGATSATPGDIGAFGLLYQWGRKDPFMGGCVMSESTPAASTGSWNVASSSNKMDFAVENPMTFATGWYGGYVAGEGWHTSESEKGLYDPCPVGYRVPDGGANGFWATALGTSDATSAGTEWGNTNYGRHWTLADGTTAAWYPAVGCRSYDSGALNDVGSVGYYWSASPYPTSYSSHAYDLLFYNGSVIPASNYNRGDGYPVRCVRE